LAKIKLNIKNTQLAQALNVGKPKIVSIPAPSKPVAKKEEETAQSAEGLIKKRKARIVQPVPEASAAIRQNESVIEPSVSEEIETAGPSMESSSAASFSSSTESSKTGSSPAAPALPQPPKAETKPLAEEKKPSARIESPPSIEVGAGGLRKPLTGNQKELKLSQKRKEQRTFDARDRHGLRDIENEAWRKRRAFKPMRRAQEEQIIIRPKEISVRLPISVKDLAHELKLKASQLISKLFMKGMILTLNDLLDDETVVQLLGHDFECDIKIDVSEQQRIQITDKTIRQEIEITQRGNLILRPPVVAFMGHVDHGKTSLIDSIRKSNRVAGEAGAITQHIGAFKVHTKAGDVTILDTPGHEAFTEMRSRGANVTDIVILVIAGDEGVRAQTDEAIRQAQDAKVPILVAVNKCDKPNFDSQKVYRDLADRQLLPECWGGTTITVNCSATTGQGVGELLEMIALQAEILELRANPETRARGTVLESEMHKGMGAVATVLVQNGTLRKNDAIVYGCYSGRVKTMQDEFGKSISEAGPSTPIKITGLSELAEAGEEFVVVKNEKEARSLAEERTAGHKRVQLQLAKLSSLEKMMAKKASGEKKILALILRADVQGSLEALKNSLLKVQSDKVRLEIVNANVGEISESDIALAAAAKSPIIGFHTRIESHAEELIRQKNVLVIQHDVIYHLIDKVKVLMKSLLDKIEKENDTGAALVKAVFKSSQLGLIAGCQVTDGTIKRTSFIRQIRNGDPIWKGKIASLKRTKEDAKEVLKGHECGILLDGQSDVQEGDIFEAYEITYLEQEL
jgi:translation initiation factor IF-2